MDAATAAFVIVIVALYLFFMWDMGLGHFFLVMACAIAIFGTNIAIGFGIYKAILYFQEGCRLSKW